MKCYVTSVSVLRCAEQRSPSGRTDSEAVAFQDQSNERKPH